MFALVERARSKQVGVADLYNACSDWSTVANVGLQFGEMSCHVAVVFFVSATNRQISATFFGKCEQAVSCSLPVHGN